MKTHNKSGLFLAAALSVSAFVSLSAADKAPRAVFQVAPDYSINLLKDAIEGDVLVDLTITPQGSVADAAIVHSTDRAFEAPVLTAIKKWRFSPGIKDGVAVATQARQLVRFRLPWLSSDSVTAIASAKPKSGPAGTSVADSK